MIEEFSQPKSLKKSVVGRAKTSARSSVVLATELKQRCLKPANVVVKTFWFRDPWNFGDTLTTELMPHFGLTPHFTPPSDAALVGVGSILHRVPPDFQGAVWGSGLIHDRQHLLTQANLLAVRGRLSADRVGAPANCALGDPGLLVSKFLNRAEKKWQLGIVPHKTHGLDEAFANLRSRHSKDLKVIDVRQSARRVARDISACSYILTSSLHGLVVADAYGIPAAWFTQNPPLVGGDFKFLDYESNFGRTRRFEFEHARSLSTIVHSMPAARDASRVEELQEGLVGAITRFRDVIDD